MRYFLFVLFALGGCTAPTPATEPTPLLTPFNVSVMIYPIGDVSISLFDVEVSATENIPTFARVDQTADSIVRDSYRVRMLTDRDSDFSVPPIAEIPLGFFHLDSAEKESLSGARWMLELNFMGTADSTFQKQRAINQFVEAITRGKHVAVVDVNSFEFFNTKSWQTLRVASFTPSPDIRSQIVIHSYREEAFCRLVSLGMNKFGLPELSINQVPCSNQNSYSELINVIAQTIIERPILNGGNIHVDLNALQNVAVREAFATSQEGALRVADVKVTFATPSEGDNLGLQLALVFDDPRFNSAQEEQQKLLTDLFGSVDGLQPVEHDEALLQASDLARKRIPELRQLFAKGLAPGYSILIKKGFPIATGGNEWMWVEVTRWDNVMEGILQNDPYEIPDLKAGALVRFTEEEIFDYILYKPDGSLEGNETGKVIEAQN